MKDLKIDTLCDLSKKDIDNHFDKVTEIVKDPKYMCEKCARVSNKKTYLCQPKKMKHIN